MRPIAIGHGNRGCTNRRNFITPST